MPCFMLHRKKPYNPIPYISSHSSLGKILILNTLFSHAAPLRVPFPHRQLHLEIRSKLTRPTPPQCLLGFHLGGKMERDA